MMCTRLRYSVHGHDEIYISSLRCTVVPLIAVKLLMKAKNTDCTPPRINIQKCFSLCPIPLRCTIPLFAYSATTATATRNLCGWLTI